ncbi:MAG TPA: hypothetical protein PK156_13265, partial [Polyangium sp.]|nr:hypothetical protein [Polyangium sp.]
LRHSKSAFVAQNTLLGIGAALLLLANTGCRRAPPQKEKAPPPAPPAASAEALKIPSSDDDDGSPKANGPATAATTVTTAPATSAGSRRNNARGPQRSTARFMLDGPELPIATGGAATVYSKGILWRLSGNSASVSLLGPNGPAPGPSEEERTKKWPRGKVAVAEDASGSMHAYWIEGRELIRHTITPDGKLENQEAVLHDAVPGSFPTALRSAGRDVVAYIANGSTRNAERHARLWVEGGGVLDLSPEGSGASSISLVPVGEGQVIAMWLDARQAMTPVHARRFEVREKTTAIAEDEVMFVGGPPEGYPELIGVRAGNSAAGMVPLSTEKGFALHNIMVNWQGKAKVAALEYPNGMDIAPVAGASACGQSVVMYTRPENKEAGAPQVLELATIGKNGAIEVEEVAAYPGQVLELSAAAIDDNTIWTVYTANAKSFALRIRCGGADSDKPTSK